MAVGEYLTGRNRTLRIDIGIQLEATVVVRLVGYSGRTPGFNTTSWFADKATAGGIQPTYEIEFLSENDTGIGPKVSHWRLRYGVSGVNGPKAITDSHQIDLGSVDFSLTFTEDAEDVFAFHFTITGSEVQEQYVEEIIGPGPSGTGFSEQTPPGHRVTYMQTLGGRTIFDYSFTTTDWTDLFGGNQFYTAVFAQLNAQSSNLYGGLGGDVFDVSDGSEAAAWANTSPLYAQGCTAKWTVQLSGAGHSYIGHGSAGNSIGYFSPGVCTVVAPARYGVNSCGCAGLGAPVRIITLKANLVGLDGTPWTHDTPAFCDTGWNAWPGSGTTYSDGGSGPVFLMPLTGGSGTLSAVSGGTIIPGGTTAHTSSGWTTVLISAFGFPPQYKSVEISPVTVAAALQIDDRPWSPASSDKSVGKPFNAGASLATSGRAEFLVPPHFDLIANPGGVPLMAHYGAPWDALKVQAQRYVYEAAPWQISPNPLGVDSMTGWHRSRTIVMTDEQNGALSLTTEGYMRFDSYPTGNFAAHSTLERQWFSPDVNPATGHRFYEITFRTVGSKKKTCMFSFVSNGTLTSPPTQHFLTSGDDGAWVTRTIDLLDCPWNSARVPTDLNNTVQSIGNQSWKFSLFAAGVTYEFQSIVGVVKRGANLAILPPLGSTAALQPLGAIQAKATTDGLTVMKAQEIDDTVGHPPRTITLFANYLKANYPFLATTDLAPATNTATTPRPLSDLFKNDELALMLGGFDMLHLPAATPPWRPLLDVPAGPSDPAILQAQISTSLVSFPPGSGDVMNESGNTYGDLTTLHFGIALGGQSAGVVIGAEDGPSGGAGGVTVKMTEQVGLTSDGTGKPGGGGRYNGFFATGQPYAIPRPLTTFPFTPPHPDRVTCVNHDGDSGVIYGVVGLPPGASLVDPKKVTLVAPDGVTTLVLSPPTSGFAKAADRPFATLRERSYWRWYGPPQAGGSAPRNWSDDTQGWYGRIWRDVENNNIVWQRTVPAVGGPDTTADWLPSPAVIVATGTDAEKVGWPCVFKDVFQRLRARWQRVTASDVDVLESISDDDGATWSDGVVAIPGGKFPTWGAPARHTLSLPVIGAAFVPDASGSPTGTIQATVQNPGDPIPSGGSPAPFTFEFEDPDHAGSLIPLTVAASAFSIAQEHAGSDRWLLTCVFAGEVDPSDWASADTCQTWLRLAAPP